jgi:hypothetical protein
MKDHFDVVVENTECSLKRGIGGKQNLRGMSLFSTRAGIEVPLPRVGNTNLIGKTRLQWNLR